MGTGILSVVTAAVLSMALIAPSRASEHRHHGVAPARPEAPAARWKADAALREGMGRIRREVLGLEHYRRGHIGAPQAVMLAGDIERDVGFVVSHCTLAPKADAALHPVLAALLRGAQSIKARPADLSAIAPMRRALETYATLFDDPEPTAAE